MVATETLKRALDQSLAYEPFYGEGFFNHLPMALHAAWELGADLPRLQAQIDHDGPVLRPMPIPPEPLAAQDWRELLGKREHYASLRALIRAEIERDGDEAVLRSHLPVLISGPQAVLFHGLIRTAHAWESGHSDELAAALASWACTWAMLPGGQGDQGMDFASWSAALRASDWRSTQSLTRDRAREALQSGAYAELCDAPVPEPHWMIRRNQLLDLALDTYLESRNFVVLHLVNAMRALRVLAPFVPDWPDVQTWLTRGFSAAWLVAGIKPRERRHAQPLEWPELKRAALAQFDAHVIKLVHTCWQEDQIQADPKWRQAAALVIG